MDEKLTSLIKKTEKHIIKFNNSVKNIKLPLVLTVVDLYTMDIIFYGLEKQAKKIQTLLDNLHNDPEITGRG